MRLEVLWRQLVGIGAEHLVLTTDEDVHADVHADGMAVGEVESSAYRLRYELDCDQGWNVERLMVEDLLNSRSLTWARLQHDRWGDGSGHELEALRGCTDVDLMVTPFTNTLPIRRLKLEPGKSQQIAVVYVSVPGLAASRVEQRYTCISRDESGGIYRYESLKTGFSANLRVDTDGLVVDYPNIFTMDAKRRLADD